MLAFASSERDEFRRLPPQVDDFASLSGGKWNLAYVFAPVCAGIGTAFAPETHIMSTEI
jgi:hypothetical protein